MPFWWSAGVPYIEAAGVALGVILGFVNLGWLVVQARRSAETHRIAVEAHGWAREKREAEQREERERQEARERQASAESARLAFWEGTKVQVENATAPIEIPDGTSAEWIIEGERRGYFRRMQHPEGRIVLWRASAG